MTKDDFPALIDKVNGFVKGLKIMENITDFNLKNVNDKNVSVRFRMYDFFGDIINKCPTYKFAKLYAQHSSDQKKVYFYEMTHGISSKNLLMGLALDLTQSLFGVFHGIDIPFVFGLPLQNPEDFYARDIVFSKTIMRYWTNFAKHG